MVPNLVVGIEIYHSSLFECTSRFAIIIAKGKWSIHGFKTVLKTGLNCDVVSNLVVEIAIYNFDIFHTALGATSSYDHIFFHFCARLHIKACVHMPLTGRELHFQSYFLINSNCSHSGHTSQKS